MALAPRNEVDEMANILAIMNGETPQRTIQNNRNANGKVVEEITLPSIGDGANVDAMKKVLQGFYGIGGHTPSKPASTVKRAMDKVAYSLVEETDYDSTLRAAMITEKTEDGSKIGEWEIYMKQEGKRKFYDVVNENGMVIATDLTLYEAAFGIARSLADGLPITHKVIRDILSAEGDYARSLTDAIHHRHSLSKNPPDGRRMVLEDRYELSKQRAQLARQKLEDLVKPPF